jgi:hypothetical protein
MITWMVYGILIGALLWTAAHGLEALARAGGAAGRWGWLLALSGLVYLSVFPLRERRVVPLSGFPAPTSMEAVGAEPAAGIEDGAGVLELLSAPIEALLRLSGGLGGASADVLLGAFWLALSVALLGAGAATLNRYGRARAGWPRARVGGREVRVSPAAGPAVMGVLRSEIVVPAWLLERSAAERRLVIEHESEHVRARDPLLLSAGALCAALVPWNPIAWWMLYRLRLAVELDCDARVLARGASPGAYGELLIEIAGRGAGIPLRAAALAASPSTLERRLRAMSGERNGFGATRAALLGLVGSVALITACEARMPTAAEVEGMDVAAVERRAAVLAVGDDMQNAVFYVDGRQVSADEARALVAARIAQVEVTRQGPDAPATIRISTSEATAGEGEGQVLRLRSDRVEGERVIRFRQDGTAAEGEGQVLRIRGVNGTATEAAILFVDGVRTDPARLRTLRPDQIEKIEIIKGDAAVEMFGEAEAANGVIRVTTKGAARTP